MSPVVHAYNCTRDGSAGYSPYSLMFGRRPRLPIDLILGAKEEVDKEAGSYHTFVRQLRDRLSEAYKVPASYIQKQQDSQRSAFDRQHLLTNASIEEGVWVLVRQF